jgi:hypothetical protein
MPALHIDTTVRELSKNVARMVVCMWMPSASLRALSGHVSPGQYSCKLYNNEYVSIFPGALTGAFLPGFAGVNCQPIWP